MNKKLLIDAIGVLLIALVVVVGYKLSPMLLPKADVTVQPDPDCNLQLKPCTASLPGGGRVELSMGTRPIPLVTPFAVTVQVSGISPSQVEVDFSGVDMSMGFNRPQLAAQGGGRFTGEASLPVCVTGRMDWQATVLIDNGREMLAIPYRFSSGDHG